MTKIPIMPRIAIDENELEESFVLASGPGGQNVNKVASAVQLRFDAAHSPSLPDDVRARLIALAGSRATKAGVIVIKAAQYRDQQRNREDARGRLVDLITKAAFVPKRRRPSKPSKASKQRGIEAKKTHSRLKQIRSKRFDD